MKGGAIIKQARARVGITQTELARRLETTQSVVARWETGRVSPTFENLNRIVKACGLNLAVFLRPPDDHELGLALMNLRLDPEQRLDQLKTAVAFAREIRRAGEQVAG